MGEVLLFERRIETNGETNCLFIYLLEHQKKGKKQKTEGDCHVVTWLWANSQQKIDIYSLELMCVCGYVWVFVCVYGCESIIIFSEYPFPLGQDNGRVTISLQS